MILVLKNLNLHSKNNKTTNIDNITSNLNCIVIYICLVSHINIVFERTNIYMVYYCEKCKKIHNENELCIYFGRQLKNSPTLLTEAVNFTNVAGQYHLVTSQNLDNVAQKINSMIGSNFSFEGTHQFSRDIQVFNRLNVETYKNAGVFRSPEIAKSYLENATKGQLTGLKSKIVGAGQEVDWLRMKQSEIQTIINKNALLTGNAPGVDGEIINRFTGEKITRVSIKGASTQGGIKTGTDGIREALKKGTLKLNDSVFATEGTKEQLLKDITREINHANSIGDKETVNILTKARENIQSGKLKIVEHGTPESITDARDRLLEKVKDGKANTNITMNDAIGKSVQGAVIGAAIGVTISSLTNYMRYRNGELTVEETFTNIGEDTLKSTLIGGSMGAITLFLPGGVVGFIAGFAIGIYISSVLTNVLDEVFGKGAYLSILQSSGYILGTTRNLSECVSKLESDEKRVSDISYNIIEKKHIIDDNISRINCLLEGFDDN